MSDAVSADSDEESPLTDDFVFVTRTDRMRVVAHWWQHQGGHCCLCHEPMEPYHRGMRSTNPEAATIEHLIPKRDDGPDTLGNVRLAHMRCNAGLGGLWAMNLHRAEKGLPLMTEEWAIGRAREQWTIRVAKRKAEKEGKPFAMPKVLLFPLPADDKPPSVKISYGTGTAKHAKNRKKPLRGSAVLGMPRGATLPGYVPPDDAVPPRRAVAPPVRSLLDGRAIKAKPMRKQPTCQECGSADVTMDASLRWDMTAQAWVIHEYRDCFDCEACRADAQVRWDKVR